VIFRNLPIAMVNCTVQFEGKFHGNYSDNFTLPEYGYFDPIIQSTGSFKFLEGAIR